MEWQKGERREQIGEEEEEEDEDVDDENDVDSVDEESRACEDSEEIQVNAGTSRRVRV